MSALTPQDSRWLDAAARYASSFLGTTADCPTVGALVVSPLDQTLVARAVTAKGGRPHAEAQAIGNAGSDAAGCTLYVTLEPCHHWGRTPPCVEAIIRSGIMRVVIGLADPDQRTAGSSVAHLQSAGIETILADHGPSRALHAGHVSRQQTKRPFVTVALKVSADSMIGGTVGSALGGPASRNWIEMLRARSDAVMIGGAAAIADDPALTVTLPGLAAHTPLRIVLAGAGGIDRKVNLIGGFSGYRTAIIAEKSVSIDAPISVETIAVNGKDGRPDLTAALLALSDRGIQNLLVEPGQRLTASLLSANLIDKLALIHCNTIVGADGLRATANETLVAALDAAGLVEVARQALGDDNLTLYERSPQPQ